MSFLGSTAKDQRDFVRWRGKPNVLSRMHSLEQGCWSQRPLPLEF